MVLAVRLQMSLRTMVFRDQILQLLAALRHLFLLRQALCRLGVALVVLRQMEQMVDQVEVAVDGPEPLTLADQEIHLPHLRPKETMVVLGPLVTLAVVAVAVLEQPALLELLAQGVMAAMEPHLPFLDRP